MHHTLHTIQILYQIDGTVIDRICSEMDQLITSKNGISSTMIPSMIVQGKGNPNFNHKRITCVSYAIVYTGTKNNIKRSIITAIAFKESNDHGRHYCMSIYTGKHLHNYQWTELPIDDDTIAQVRDLSEE